MRLRGKSKEDVPAQDADAKTDGGSADSQPESTTTRADDHAPTDAEPRSDSSTTDTGSGDLKTDPQTARSDHSNHKASKKEAKDAKREERRQRSREAGEKVKAGSDAIRSRIASVVWLIAVVAALFLAIGALLTTINAANEQNDIVSFITETADKLAGPLGNLFESKDKDADAARTKDTLVNWGIAAVVYLVAGKVLDRIIRP